MRPRQHIKGERSYVYVLTWKSDHGSFYRVISKAEGCAETKILDPNFIDRVRRYEGACFGEAAWDHINTDIDPFLRNISSGEELDNKTDTSYLNFAEITCQSHAFGQALFMRPFQKIKGE